MAKIFAETELMPMLQNGIQRDSTDWCFKKSADLVASVILMKGLEALV